MFFWDFSSFNQGGGTSVSRICEAEKYSIWIFKKGGERRRKLAAFWAPRAWCRQMRMMGNLGGSYADSKLAQVRKANMWRPFKTWEQKEDYTTATLEQGSVLCQVLYTLALARRLPPNVLALPTTLPLPYIVASDAWLKWLAWPCQKRLGCPN